MSLFGENLAPVAHVINHILHMMYWFVTCYITTTSEDGHEKARNF